MYTHVPPHSQWMAKVALNPHLLVKKKKNKKLFGWCSKMEIEPKIFIEKHVFIPPWHYYGKKS